MSARILGVVFLFCCIGFLCPPRVFASRTITILSPDFSIQGSSSYTVMASASGFDDGEHIRVKGALYKEGSSNYFGYTRNEDVWIKNSAATDEQPQVVIGQWSGSLDIKNDPLDSGFVGDGPYRFKLRFYYGQNGSDWSENIVNVLLIAPTPTNTPSPSPSPTPKESVRSSPTDTPSPTIILTVQPTSMPTKRPTPAPIGATASGILGIQMETPVVSSNPAIRASSESVSGMRQVAHIGLGIGSLLALLATTVSYRQSRIWKKEHTDL